MDILNFICDNMWYVALVLIALLGVYCTIKLKGMQITDFKEMCRVTFSSEERKLTSKVSSFQVFCISMGSRIGVGNISGPILAILVGGPGAIFWIWVFALIGMATSFIETSIGQLFKERKADGEFRGGPAYNVKNGLNMKRLSIFVAVVMIAMYLLGFMSMEVSSMTEAFCGAFDFAYNNLVFGIVLSILAILIFTGGLVKIAKLSVKIVPVMAILWIVVCIISIILSDGGVVNAVAMIFSNIFTVPSAVGGGLGAMLVIGMKRGILSNEAGIGTIPNISSISNVNHPARQGYSQALGVFIDTILCTMTALVILSYGSIDSIMALDMESMPLLQEVLGTTIGSFAPYAVAVFMFIFAFTCMMSDFIIGENNLSFITESRNARIAMYVFTVAVVFISCLMASDSLFVIVDIMLAICGIINVYVMARIGYLGFEVYKDYKRQKSEGVDNPVFKKSSLSNTSGITEWED